MLWILKSLALAAALGSAATPQTAGGEVFRRPAEAAAPLRTTDRTLLASLTRISGGSASWREAMHAVSRTGRHALVVTPPDVVVKGRRRFAFDEGVLAEAVPVLDRESRITSVVVVVNLRLVQRLHDDRLSVPRDFEADLDRILVHEIYGHAVPYLLAGDLSGRCADPRKGEDVFESCSIRRENAVRAELGLGNRADYGLSSLVLARFR